MDNKNSNLKEEIRDKVQSAIESKDFTNLNNDITSSVNSALEELRYRLRYKPVDEQPVSNKAQTPVTPDNSAPRSNVHIGFMSSQTIAYKPPTGSTSSKQISRNAASVPAKTPGKQAPAVAIPHRPVGKIKGSFYYALGITATALTSVGTLALAAVSSALPSVTALSVTTGGLFMSLPFWIILTWRGSSIRKRYTRFQMYMSRLRSKGYASISELARSVGRSEQYVIRDLQKMLSDGMFLEGHFDEKYTCFIANNASWQQYMAAQDGYYNRVNSTASAGTQDTVIDESKRQNDKVNAVIKQGTEYIQKIRQINDELPDEEISSKLDTLETTIDKIFQHIDEHPEQLPELDKFIQYYMPTTLKLITVYRDFDIQPIQGENINTAKKEILGTLDTINHAFIKLFDSLFQATAWDVSADISVLETMLAREGLTKSVFETKGE
ncbi:MAG: hypothetical protein E7261_10255 [Lachnospiraceae bacterium]|nr:hypothetical protein [Lachnospiraceae bacterium]